MSGWAADRHLTDEELSELVDGLAGPEVEGHVADCPSCAARLDGWRSVSARLAALAGSSASVPASARRDEAVAAAMAAKGGDAWSGIATGGGRPWRSLRPLSAAAAAVVVVAGIAVGVAHLDHGGAKSTRQAGGPTSVTSAAGPASASAAGPAGRQSLGTLNGPASVATAVDRALRGAAVAPFAPSASPAAGSGAAGPASSGAGAGSPVPARSKPADVPAAGLTPACPDTARLFPGVSPQLLLAVDGVYNGTPAHVYAYQAGGIRRAVVVAANGCALLADVPLPAG